MKARLWYVIIISGLLGSCNTNMAGDIKEAEEQVPQIWITQPTTNTSYTPGDTVRISGFFTDPVEIHSYAIQIWDVPSGNLIEDLLAGHEHKDTVSFNTAWQVRNAVSDTVVVVFTVNNHNRITTENRVPLHIVAEE